MSVRDQERRCLKKKTNDLVKRTEKEIAHPRIHLGKSPAQPQPSRFSVITHQPAFSDAASAGSAGFIAYGSVAGSTASAPVASGWDP
jgi:hypothetical protein